MPKIPGNIVVAETPQLNVPDMGVGVAETSSYGGGLASVGSGIFSAGKAMAEFVRMRQQAAINTALAKAKVDYASILDETSREALDSATEQSLETGEVEKTWWQGFQKQIQDYTKELPEEIRPHVDNALSSSAELARIKFNLEAASMLKDVKFQTLTREIIPYHLNAAATANNPAEYDLRIKEGIEAINAFNPFLTPAQNEKISQSFRHDAAVSFAEKMIDDGYSFSQVVDELKLEGEKNKKGEIVSPGIEPGELDRLKILADKISKERAIENTLVSLVDKNTNLAGEVDYQSAIKEAENPKKWSELGLDIDAARSVANHLILMDKSERFAKKQEQDAKTVSLLQNINQLNVEGKKDEAYKLLESNSGLFDPLTYDRLSNSLLSDLKNNPKRQKRNTGGLIIDVARGNTPSDPELQTLVATGEITEGQLKRVKSFIEKKYQDKENVDLAIAWFQEEISDDEDDVKEFATALDSVIDAKDLHGPDILETAKKIGEDKSSFLDRIFDSSKPFFDRFFGEAPYEEEYRRLIEEGIQPSGLDIDLSRYTDEQIKKATDILRKSNYPITPSNLAAVMEQLVISEE